MSKAPRQECGDEDHHLEVYDVQGALRGGLGGSLGVYDLAHKPNLNHYSLKVGGLSHPIIAYKLKFLKRRLKNILFSCSLLQIISNSSLKNHLK
jgi:hypothetical protein